LIQREGFLDGKTSIINGDSSAPQYTDVSGANRKSKKGANTFHSTKIVERKNSQLKTIFKELNFSKSPIGSKNLYTASNEGIDVRIFKDRRRIKAVYSLKGKYDKIFGVFDGGSKKEKITDSKGKTKNVRRGQRRVIRQGLGKALRRWDKINKFYLEKTIKARNLAKL